MPANPFENSIVPAKGYLAITPADGTGVQWATGPIRSLYVGGAGNVRIIGLDGSDVVITGLVAGAVYQFPALRIMATSTTATALVGLY